MPRGRLKWTFYFRNVFFSNQNTIDTLGLQKVISKTCVLRTATMNEVRKSGLMRLDGVVLALLEKYRRSWLLSAYFY